MATTATSSSVMRNSAVSTRMPGPMVEARVTEPKHAATEARALHAAPAPSRADAAKPGAAKPGAAKPDTAKADKAVAFAQRALVKLGYGPLTIDGIAGPSTRAALDRFERERRLPGAAVPRRTLLELAARSGLTPE